MKYDVSLDLWVDESGARYIKNEYDKTNPGLINVTTQVWSAVWKGRLLKLNWDEINLPPDIKNPIYSYISQKLKSGKVALTYMEGISLLLRNLNNYWPAECKEFKNLNLNLFLDIWNKLKSSKSSFRQLLTDLSHSQYNLVDEKLVIRINSWKARSNVKTLKEVVEWNPKTGSLTSAELAQLRKVITKVNLNENSIEHAIRLIIWVMMEVGKRTEQILSMRLNALKIISKNGINEYFLEIPKSKNQSGAQPQTWPISEPLGKEIKRFSERSDISYFQKSFDRLFVWHIADQFEQLNTHNVGGAIKRYVYKLNIISSRTNEKLHITPYRLRHSLATRLAAKGAQRDVITNLLEHDSNESAQAYIDAIGSDLVPAIERADRNLGNLFKDLNNAFFVGKITNNLNKHNVFIPIFESNPLPVGSCGKNTVETGSCKKQPFSACYNGCPNFLAWKDADHGAALKYVENELERWNTAEGHNNRSKVMEEFDQVYKAINEVIQQVEEINKNA